MNFVQSVNLNEKQHLVCNYDLHVHILILSALLSQNLSKTSLPEKVQQSRRQCQFGILIST